MTARSRWVGAAWGLGLLPAVVLGCGASDGEPGDDPAPTHATQDGSGESEPDENEPNENERGDGENEPDENEPGQG